MSVFDPKSRYARYARRVTAIDRRGRVVAAVSPAELPAQAELGRHRLRQGQRLDHLAAHYLGDPAGFWRIAELEDAFSTEAALDAPLVRIPTRS